MRKCVRYAFYFPPCITQQSSFRLSFTLEKLLKIYINTLNLHFFIPPCSKHGELSMSGKRVRCIPQAQQPKPVLHATQWRGEAALPSGCALFVSVLSLLAEMWAIVFLLLCSGLKTITHRLHESRNHRVIFHRETKGGISLNQSLPLCICNDGLQHQIDEEGCQEGI